MILRLIINAPRAPLQEPPLNPLLPRLSLVAALLTLPLAARADRRYYGETYNAATAAPGGLDVELWSSLHQAPRSGGERLWRNQLELETGITDRWDVALYNVWDSPRGESTRYAQTRLESRYRPSQPGEWFVDPVLYVEVKKEWTDDRPVAVEEKLILGKDLGRLNLSLNGSAEQEFIPGGGRAYEYAYAVGASHELAAWLRAGAEAFGAHQREGGQTVTTHYAGPALSVAWSRVWLVTAVGFGLNHASERLRATAVLAFQL